MEVKLCNTQQSPSPKKPQQNPLYNNKNINRLEKSLSKATEKKNKASCITNLIENHKNEIITLSHQINSRIAYNAYANVCAIKIQKVFRGYMTRNQNDDVSFT